MEAALSAPVSLLRPPPFLSPNPNPNKETPAPRFNLLLLTPRTPPPPPTSDLLSLPSFPYLAPDPIPKPKPKPKPPPPSTSSLPIAPLPGTAAHGPVHRRAATGYAAALADAALRAGSLGAAARGARRLARADPAAAAAAAAAEGGGLERHVAAMVRLLVGKGRAGMVAEVAAEFERICDELGATETVAAVAVAVKKKGRARHLSAAV